MNKYGNFWTVTAALLIGIIVVGGLVIWSRYSPGQPIEITIPQQQELPGRIYIDGDVTIPGVYAFTTGDTLEGLIEMAGGIGGSANLSGLKLYIPGPGGGQEPQRVDINRAETWLLEALPGIGETLARRIIDYRQENGPFRNSEELLRVAGIGLDTYEQIKQLITVSD